jgi:hypothetical protein
MRDVVNRHAIEEACTVSDRSQTKRVVEFIATHDGTVPG